MFEFNKMKYKVVTHTLVALVLLQALIDPTEAAMKCYKCTGINCQRTTYTATEDCADELDSCVSVYEGSMRPLNAPSILCVIIFTFVCQYLQLLF